jgi:hypothetical protein
MLHLSKHNLESASKRNNSKDVVFFKRKYTKYIIKFLQLYKGLHKTNQNNRDLFDLTIKTIKADKENNDLIKEALGKTNLAKIMEKFTDNPNIKKCYGEILEYVLEHVLGKYMKVYKHHYDVVVGGSDLYRCISQKFKIASYDIDIRHIVTDKKYTEDAKRNRHAFLNSVAHDEELLEFITTLQKTYGLAIELEITEPSNDIESKLYKIQLRNIKVVFKEPNGQFIKSVVMIDSMISNIDIDNEKYNEYIGKDLKFTIPYYVDPSSKVIYATCNWIYYNTIQLLKLFNSRVEDIDISKNPAFITFKFAKLLMKFTALFLVANKHHIQYSKLEKVYKQMQRIVLGDDMITVASLFKIYKNIREITDFDNLTKNIQEIE